MADTDEDNRVVTAALQAFDRGWTPLPIKSGLKSPAMQGWSTQRWYSAEEIRRAFYSAEHPIGGVGLALGENSGGLVDVDLDHPRSRRLAPLVLPRTAMKSGRDTSRRSHWWYSASKNTPPATKQWKFPNGDMIVELRSTGGQTVIPPSIHPSGESYIWDGEPFGGDLGPSEADGDVLTARVATLALVTLLSTCWPNRGGRHAAHLALAGALLRTKTGDAHPLWVAAAEGVLITIGEATDDEEAAQRAREVVPSTLRRIETGGKVQGWPTLAKIIGDRHASAAHQIVSDIERALGHDPSAPSSSVLLDEGPKQVDLSDGDSEPQPSEIERGRDPEAERLSSWDALDLAPYLAGEVKLPEPNLLRRQDGAYLLYPGRVNMLYGAAESAKSWLAVHTAIEAMDDGKSVLYIDCEDDPLNTLARMTKQGTDAEQILERFSYVRPDGPLTPMTMPRWGQVEHDERRERNDVAFENVLSEIDPDLIIVDGMTALYGLHGLDTNDSSQTDRITSWLRSLAGAGKAERRPDGRTVLVIDHVQKGATRASTAIGSQHKMAMVQGTALHVYVIDRPRPGARGEMHLIVGKDRPGQVRAVSTNEDPQTAAKFVLDSTAASGMVDISIELPPTGVMLGDSDPGNQKLTDLHVARWKICDELGRVPEGLNQANLFAAVGGNKNVIKDALSLLVQAGNVRIVKKGRAHVHVLDSRPADLVEDFDD